jgi:biopolymer transport protein TolR
MAFATGGKKGLENDINVTPMIDVLLVLLIIFMAALPSMRKAIDVQLPDPNPSVQPANQKNDQIVLEVNPNGQYLINSQAHTREDLPLALKSVYEGRPDKVLFIKGNPLVKYKDVVDAMDVARGAGVLVIGVPPKDLGAPGAATTKK